MDGLKRAWRSYDRGLRDMGVSHLRSCSVMAFLVLIATLLLLGLTVLARHLVGGYFAAP